MGRFSAQGLLQDPHAGKQVLGEGEDPVSSQFSTEHFRLFPVKIRVLTIFDQKSERLILKCLLDVVVQLPCAPVLFCRMEALVGLHLPRCTTFSLLGGGVASWESLAMVQRGRCSPTREPGS